MADTSCVQLTPVVRIARVACGSLARVTTHACRWDRGDRVVHKAHSLHIRGAHAAPWFVQIVHLAGYFRNSFKVRVTRASLASYLEVQVRDRVKKLT